MFPAKEKYMAAPTAPYLPIQSFSAGARKLTDDDDSNEVLQFLAQRLPDTVVMSGLIRDHGFVNDRNRGTFHSYRDAAGRLRGVALIGHATFIDTSDDDAMKAFAVIAQRCKSIHMILGQHELMNSFWKQYALSKRLPRRRCRELLFEQRKSIKLLQPVPSLCLATLEDLDLIIPIHAQLAFEESGINPLQRDAAGFRERCAQRIAKGRVWAWIDEGTLMFKADIASDLPEAIYIEGVYVDPRHRRRGHAIRCLTQLGNILLERTKALYVLVNENNMGAQALLHHAGYQLRDRYDTIFLQPGDDDEPGYISSK
jgi:ribosomal protein S18 acetylase RimI-like enzyme